MNSSIVFILLLIIKFSTFCAAITNATRPEGIVVDRQAKLITYKVTPTPCGVGNSGVCYPRNQCFGNGRTRINGTCAFYSAVITCCQFNFTAAADGDTVVISEKVATIQSNDNVNSHIFEFTKLTDYCQLKLDFLELDFTLPTAAGDCVDDKLALSGSITTSNFVLCGNKLPTRPLYLTFGMENKITVDIMTATNGKKFKIKVTQIRCNSRNLVGDQCLQQYPAGGGNVTSFGYPDYQINGQEYSVCIGNSMTSSSRTIRWSTCAVVPTTLKPSAFYLSNYFGAGGTGGVLAGGFGHDTCERTSYVALPQGDKYCGAVFPSQTNDGWPNVLSVRFIPDSVTRFEGGGVFSTLFSTTNLQTMRGSTTIFETCTPLFMPNTMDQYACTRMISTPPVPAGNPPKYGFCLTYA